MRKTFVEYQMLGDRKSSFSRRFSEAAGQRVRLRAVPKPESRPGAACPQTTSVHLALGPSGNATRNNIVSHSALRGSRQFASAYYELRQSLSPRHAQVPRTMSDQASPYGGASQCFLPCAMNEWSDFTLATTFSHATAATSHLHASSIRASAVSPPTTLAEGASHGDNNDHAPGLGP